jgi:hypothetical protein
VRGRLWLFVLLASALTFLVSLFLPWRDTTAPAVLDGAGAEGLLNLLEGRQVDGWLAVAGDVAVLVVVAIVLATVAALRRPQLAPNLPIGGLGVALGYFAVAVAVEVHTLSQVFVGGFTGHPPAIHGSWTYGFYLGLASGGVALLSGLAYRRNELVRRRVAGDFAAAGLGIALLVSFLLPWAGISGARASYAHGIESPAALIAALALFCGAGRLSGEAWRLWRLPLAIAIAVLTGGAVSGIAVFTSVPLYGAWIGVGCAVSLVAREAVRAWPMRILVPHGLAALRTGAAALLIVALFLPWREGIDGWYSPAGAATGCLCLLLLGTAVVPALENYVLDAMVAIAIFVAALATAFRGVSSFYNFGNGAYVGIAATGILLVTALAPLRLGHVDRRRARARAVPLATSVLCVAAVAVPSWSVLPEAWSYQAAPLYGFLVVPGVLFSLYLVRLWALRVRGSANPGEQLIVVPLVLLALTALDLIRFRNGDVVWGAVIVVGLCLLLALCGWFEEGSRVPGEIWRVDRLPEPES